MLLSNILFALWFFLPVGIANCAPIFAAKIPYIKDLSYPLDFYKTYNGKRILGDHKTIRGFIVGLCMAILAVIIQVNTYISLIGPHSFIPIDYTHISPWIFGTLCAIGALGGDAIKSFVKRQLSISPGKMWFPFDQLDYIIGGILTTFLYIPLSLNIYFLIITFWFILHITASIIGYVLRLKQVPW